MVFDGKFDKTFDRGLLSNHKITTIYLVVLQKIKNI